LHLNLMAFPNVASVAGIELAEVAVAGLKADRVIISYTALRGFIERTAHAAALAEALAPIKLAPIDGPLTAVLELSDVVSRALYGTQRNGRL
jgi:hypothetical protein